MKWFISYARRDSKGDFHPVHEFVKRDFSPLMRAALNVHGLGDVYSDHDDDGSPRCREQILKRLRGAHGVIALVDFRYVERPWCRFELEVGLHLQANGGGGNRLIVMPLTHDVDALKSELARVGLALAGFDGPDLLHKRIQSGREPVSPVFSGAVRSARARLATRIEEYVVRHFPRGTALPVVWTPELELKAGELLLGKTS